MQKELLLEGGVGGHMNHPYDIDELTFGDLKDMLRAAANGELQGSEKTDGQNLYITFDVDSQKAKAIRNQTQIKAGGLTPEQLDDFFSDHPAQALRYSFVEALLTFENFVVGLPKKTQLEIFGPEGAIYFNTEIMNPGTPGFDKDDPKGMGTKNVIPYDKKTVLIHPSGHKEFERETAKDLETNLTSNYRILKATLEGKEVEDPAVFSIETHPVRKLHLKGLEKANDLLSKTISQIDNIVKDSSSTDDTSIIRYVIDQVKADINTVTPGLSEQRLEDLAIKFLKLCKRTDDKPGYLRCGDKKNKKFIKPNENIRNLIAGLSGDELQGIRSFASSFSEGRYRRPLALALADFTNAILDGFDSSFISDNEKQLNALKGELSKVMRQIAKSDNEAAKSGLRIELEKLKNIDNINTPSEGFVFNFKGEEFKFTGAFSPMNQILGIPKFKRYGEIAPMETIAVFPGSFKPPHRGHLEVIKTISQNADKTLVIVSRPLQKQRTLPISGKTIGSTEAINLIRAMLEGTGLEDKVEVMSGNTASPMPQTINFVTMPVDPENPLVAPKNAEVILGVGDKGSDADRYGSLSQQVAKMRPDIDLETTPVPAVTHDESYIKLLGQYKDILERMPSKTSGAGVAFFHASDMRFLMDLAAEDYRAVELLADFVGMPERVPTFLQAIGITPVDDDKEPEEDQVQEPEVNPEEVDMMDPDEIAEIIYKETLKVFEGFKSQRVPKGRPSRDKFQRKMRKRLSKAHGIYLDMGRKDLTKHGGGFRMDRKKDVSNAFLAEEDIEEMSTVGGGGMHMGPVAPKHYAKRDDAKMNKQEQKLRRKIRISLQEFFKRKSKQHEDSVAEILEEHKLRMQLRSIILEQSLNEVEDPTTDVHDNTGINTLKDLMKNTNVLATLREVYKTLTTDENQKRSFRAHIIKWVEDTLAPVRLNDTERGTNLSEEVGVDIEGVDSSMFLDDDGITDGSEKDIPQEPEEETMQAISGEDTTGRNKAERVYPSIEKSIVDYYSELDNPEDQEMFYDYLIANLKLYFDKWDSEMSKSVEEPTNTEYDQAAQPV